MCNKMQIATRARGGVLYIYNRGGGEGWGDREKDESAKRKSRRTYSTPKLNSLWESI